MVSVFIAVFFFGCKKDDTVINIPCVQLTNTEILVQKDWQIDELWKNDGGVNTHFVRGGVNTTGTSYENMRFHFNTEGTGSYTDEVSTIHTLDWSYNTSDERNMTLNIGPPFANVFIWNMIELKNNFMHNTSPYGGGLISIRYIQVP